MIKGDHMKARGTHLTHFPSFLQAAHDVRG